MASDEFLKERRLRRLRSMFGPGSVVLPQEDVNGQAGRSDGMVKAWLTHPDGRLENLRMTRDQEEDQNESSV